MKNKKGILGLNTTTSFIVTLLILAVTAFAVIISLAALNESPVADRPALLTQFLNQTTTPVNESGSVQLAGTKDLDNCAATVTAAINSTTNATVIESGNYSVSGCTIDVSTATTPWNVNVTWAVSGNYSYTQKNQTSAILQNVSGGISSFFGNATTWFSLLAIVVILLIIAIVIITVRRFEGGGMGGGMSASGGSRENLEL